MNLYLDCLVIIILNTVVVYSEIGVPEVRACQDQLLLLGSDKNMAKIVDVPIGSNVKMDCDFCNEKDNHQAKIWYFKKRGVDAMPVEVLVGMNNNNIKNKVTLSPSHTLSIANFSMGDRGIYTCKRLNVDEDSVFTYVLDGVFPELIMPKTGKISQWLEYKRINFDPVNEKFDKANVDPFLSLRKKFNLTFRIMTSWESWEPCEVCGRRKGIRRKLGKCRLHPISLIHSNHSKILPESVNETMKDVMRYYIIDDYDVSCRSRELNKTFPELSKIIRKVPEIEVTEPCDGICVPAEGGLSGKKGDYKYKVVKHIAEKSHLTLVCPETTLESSVQWYKDKNLLNASFRNNMADNEEEPHLTIDAYNNLYILHATKNEEGIYTCNVDDRKMQKFDVRVVSKSKLLNQEFIRYSIYLGFVLSLTITCFCAGMCVAWHRRSSFADPLNLNKNKRKEVEEEHLLKPDPATPRTEKKRGKNECSEGCCSNKLARLYGNTEEGF